MEIRGYASVVYVRDQKNRVAIILEQKRPSPRWKYPGGSGDPGETPVGTAVRECKEESGIVLLPSNIVLIEETNKGNHDFFFFYAIVDTFGAQPLRGDKGEQVKIVRKEELRDMPNFLPDHRKLLHLVERHEGAIRAVRGWAPE